MAAADITKSPVHVVESIAQGAQATTLLTDNSGGTASDTIVDVPAAYAETTLANQIASLAAKINAIINLLRA